MSEMDEVDFGKMFKPPVERYDDPMDVEEMATAMREEIEQNWLDDGFFEDILDRYPVTKHFVLRVLQLILKQLQADFAAAGKPENEDAVETSVRRELAVSEAVKVAMDVILEKTDGSSEETQFLIAEVMLAFSKKTLHDVQRQLLARDIQKRVGKNT